MSERRKKNIAKQDAINEALASLLEKLAEIDGRETEVPRFLRSMIPADGGNDPEGAEERANVILASLQNEDLELAAKELFNVERIERHAAELLIDQIKRRVVVGRVEGFSTDVITTTHRINDSLAAAALLDEIVRGGGN